MFPIVTLLALAVGTLAPQDRVDERRTGTAVMLHRGSSDLAVENTLAACEASFLHGLNSSNSFKAAVTVYQQQSRRKYCVEQLLNFSGIGFAVLAICTD